LARDLGKTEAEINAMPSAEFVRWMAFYIVDFQRETDTEPPQEFDSDSAADAALDDLLGW
jgi:hypothetical protein